MSDWKFNFCIWTLGVCVGAAAATLLVMGWLAWG